jgi:hypothetical protein
MLEMIRMNHVVVGNQVKWSLDIALDIPALQLRTENPASRFWYDAVLTV